MAGHKAEGVGPQIQAAAAAAAADWALALAHKGQE